MHHRSVVMLPLPSSLRSLIRLSRRLRAPNPRLLSPPVLARLRFLSSSPSDGAGWTTYDPLTGSLAPSAGISSASSSAAADSDTETPADSNTCGVFDPVAGRIVLQGQPYPPPPPSSNSDEEDNKENESVEEEEAVKEKGKGKSSGGEGQGRWSAVAAARKAAKEKVSYVCSHCGEGSSQWWGVCRHCQATGTLTKYVPQPDTGAVEGSHRAVRSWIRQKSKEMMPQSPQEVTKGVDQAEWRIPLLAPSAAISSASSSTADSDTETPADSNTCGVFDPVTGSIVLQGQPYLPPPPSSNSDEEDNKENESVEEEEAVKEKGEGKSSGGESQGRWSAVAAARKATKEKVSYVCSHCGEGSSQWWGVCRHCQATGTLTKYVPQPDTDSVEGSHHAIRSWIPQKSKEMMPQSLQEVTKGVDQAEWRMPLPGSFGMEVARVLGGGIVPGSLVLVGGDPGVGKSSLLLQLASIVSEGIKAEESSSVVYVSGEESIEQIGNRADRMSIRSRNLYLYSSTDIEDILDKIQPLSPRALIVDSIQTVYLRAFAGSAGNTMQVKECTSALLRFAKLTNIPVFLIGHVTKAGDIAGPRLLEHIVDVVLYMEGERCLSHRLLRSVKNRFGSADELGVFEMSEHGLQAVLNPSEMFLTEHDSDSEILAGLAVAVILDGSRTFAIEVQALCVSGSPNNGQVVGIPTSRADVIISVLTKQAGLKLHDNAIFLNVVSGFKLTETAGDLAIAASICSSFLEFPIPNDIAFIGEIGLGGELRSVPRMDKRVIAISKLGYKKCVVPKTSEKLLKPLNLDIEILPCSNLKEVINTVFRPQG